MTQEEVVAEIRHLEALDVLLGRKLLRRRRAAGLSQRDLAKRASIRVETLCRIEAGKSSPSVRTVEKIDRALKHAEAQERQSNPQAIATPGLVRQHEVLGIAQRQSH